MRIPEFVTTTATAAVATILRLLAQEPPPALQPPPPPQFEVVERGADFRIERSVSPVTAEDGSLTSVTNTWTTLATGLHYWENGQWLDTVAAFEEAPDVFIAQRGPHKVILNLRLDTPDAVDLLTPDGTRLRSAPVFLAYRNRLTGQTVLLDEVRPGSVGGLVSPNTVLWPDAFPKVGASVQATYSPAGFEMDVVLNAALPAPEGWGLDPATTDIEVYTEFLDSAFPASATRESLPNLPDTRLTFGSMQMDRGEAFVLSAVDGRKPIHAPVRKEFLQLEGRPFLIESTPYPVLREHLNRLPAQDQGVQRVRQFQVHTGREELLVQSTRPGSMPAAVIAWASRARDAGPASGMASRVAKARSLDSRISAPSQGIVLDYFIANTTTNFTFVSHNTYFVTNTVVLSGTTTFEGGTVIKHANVPTAKIQLQSGGILDWRAEPYLPVTFTTMDDNSIGETVAGSVGSPFAIQGTCLQLNGVTVSGGMIQNARFRYCETGLDLSGQGLVDLRHSQFVACTRGIILKQPGRLQNLLFHGGDYPLVATLTNSITAAYLTVDQVFDVYDPGPGAKLTMINSLLVNVDSLSSFTNIATVATNTTGTNIFMVIGAGVHYLNPACDLKGTVDPYAAETFDDTLSTEFVSSRQLLTTSPPAILTTNISGMTILSPAPIWDQGTDPGYHYWTLDYAWSGLEVTNATLAITNGVVVAHFGTNGTILRSGGNLTAASNVDRLNRFVWYQAVQEQPVTWGATGANRRMLSVPASSSVGPTAQFNFTAFQTCADSAARRELYADGANWIRTLQFKNCQFGPIQLTFAESASPPDQSVIFDNNLFRRAGVRLGSYKTNRTLVLRSSLFLSGSIYTATQTAPPSYAAWTVRDNLFDGTTLSGYAPSYIETGFNAYTAASAWFGGSSNRVGIVASYLSGPLGSYYYPSTGSTNSLAALIDGGSRYATNSGLFHFTTRGDQAAELNSVVDIGFHYPACTSQAGSSPICDNDGDGLPNIFEDLNGNGLYDSGEFNWTDADTDNDAINDNQEFGGNHGGEAVAWGQSTGGKTTPPAFNPASASDFIAIAAGDEHSLALRFDGTVTAFGSNTYGQCSVPSNASNVVAIAAGGAFSMALRDDGVIVCWGANDSGQGVPPSVNTNFIAIAAGGRHYLALKSDGTVVAQGANDHGQTSVPGGLSGVVGVSAGGNHSMALKTNRSAVGWGDNTSGQATGSTGGSTLIEVSAGWSHNVGLCVDGVVVAWGDSASGACSVPSGLSNVVHVAAGRNFSLALKGNGSVVGWGDNSYGQTNAPVTLTNAIAVAAGQRHALALPYTPTLDYPINSRRDLLIVYNDTFTNSINMLQYYLDHRPRLASPQLLGVSLGSSDAESLSLSDYNTKYFYAVSNWFRANAGMHPSHILLMYGIPNLRSDSSFSLQHLLRADLNTHFGYKPFVSALNFFSTNDCANYIKKLESIGTNNPINRHILSADRAGIVHPINALDNTRVFPAYQFQNVVSNAPAGLSAVGIPSANVRYADNFFTGIYNYSTSIIRHATNVLAYVGWGQHAGVSAAWATDGTVNLHGDSNWYIAEVLESLNGQWSPGEGQHSYREWFTSSAFGGTNWINTPVVALSSVNEPRVTGYFAPGVWLPLWNVGRSSARSAWLSQPARVGATQPESMQLTGDPLIQR